MLRIPESVVQFIKSALEEDIGNKDVTSELLIPEGLKSKAIYLAKEDFILAGIPFAELVFKLLDPTINFKSYFKEGSSIKKGYTIAKIKGNAYSILAGERLSLNILQRLSGIATLTNKYIEEIKGTKARILDTRKTTPCMRYMEKYAVRIGGGNNHRFGLFDGILIKDNHIALIGNIKDSIKRAKTAHHLLKIEVEVKNLREFKIALESGADIIMLDNMPIDEIKEAVRINRKRAILEVSGGITIENVREVAKTGVDYISIGAITHSAKAVDISLEIIK